MNEQIQVLFEDKHVLAVVKPAGIPTQSGRISQQDMVSLLKNRLAEAGKDTYLGLIHRLDQPVEGIIVFAKTPFAARDLSQQVQDGRMGKYYLAASSEKVHQKSGTLENFLEKDNRTNSSKVVSAKTKLSKKAVLHYELISESEQMYYYKIKLDTGRHHQIRVQAAFHGFPLAGDRKYNTKLNKEEDVHNLALCAYRLVFQHPKTKEQLKFEIKPSGYYFKQFV